MSTPKAPPAPDYSGVAAASAESARYSFKLGQDQLAWAKEQYASDKATTDKVVDAALKVQETNDATAAKDRARYEQIYQPVEDSFVKDAMSYNDPAKSEARAGAAASSVSQEFERARNNATAQLEAYGVDPSQTRAAALDLGTRTQEAAARASAANTSRLQSEATGNQLKTAAIDIGKGYPASIAQQYGTGAQAGSMGVNSSLATTASGANTMGTAPQWQTIGNSGIGQQANILNMGYNNALSRFQANSSASSGIGGLLGTVAGLAGRAAMFAEGGSVPEPEDMAIPMGAPASAREGGEWSHSGIPVHASMSPSHGQQKDDIPARLNAGEFIIPEDTVRWFGEKHFQNMIEKGRKDQQGAPAKPEMQAIPAERPDVRSSALPVG